MRAKNIVLVLFLFFGSYAVYSSVYKWIDKNGTTHYGNNPENNTIYKEIKIEKSKISNSGSKDKSTDTLNAYTDELYEKVEEIKGEAESCYYNAINRKIFDISCKNYKTLLDRDFKPLVREIKAYLLVHPGTGIDYFKKKLNQIEDIAEDADEKFNSAIKYLQYLIN